MRGSLTGGSTITGFHASKLPTHGLAKITFTDARAHEMHIESLNPCLALGMARAFILIRHLAQGPHGSA